MSKAQAKVLIVEDDPDARETLRLLLEIKGCRADTAANGREALAKLKRCRARPRLILLDLRMPIMGGRELCAALLEDDRLAGVPVVVVSSEPDLPREAAELGAAAYLEKPLDAARLDSILERYAAPRPLHATAAA